MIPESDPRVAELVEAWLRYAKQNGIATPNLPGEQAQGHHVYEFLIDHLKQEHNFTLNNKTKLKLQDLLLSQASGVSDTDSAALDRVKNIIDNKLTPEQKEQLVRELKRV